MNGSRETWMWEHAFDKGGKSILLEQKNRENVRSRYVFSANLKTL